MAFGLTTRGEIEDPAVTREFERFYSKLDTYLSQTFDEDGQLVVATPTGIVPVGAILDFGGSTAPDKWLLCDGSQVSRATYSSLFNIVGTTYGVGDGSTTFNLPDARQKFTLGMGTSGTGAVLGEVGGTIDHFHSTGSHTHSFSATTDTNGDHSHSTGTGSSTTVNVEDNQGHPIGLSFANANHTHSTSTNGNHSHSVSGTTGSGSGGSTGAANPPYITFNKIIYAGI